MQRPPETCYKGNLRPVVRSPSVPLSPFGQALDNLIITAGGPPVKPVTGDVNTRTSLEKWERCTTAFRLVLKPWPKSEKSTLFFLPRAVSHLP